METRLNILVVEDEGIIAELLRMMLEEMGHAVSKTAHSLEEALEALKDNSINFAVLDINLEGGMEGIEVAQVARDKNIPFMFLTSYADRHTVEKAKHTKPGAYVLKPFTEEELFAGIEMTLMHSNRPSAKVITVKDGHKNILLKVNEIVMLRADNIYVEVHTEDRKILTRQTLSTFLDELPIDKFIRVHRSYAVNREFITSVSRNSLEVREETIPISRSFREHVHALLNT